MVFADADTCPDCRAPLDGTSTCPLCRLDLSTSEARELWQTLQAADALLARARRHRVPVPPVPSRAFAPVPVASPAPVPSPAPMASREPAQERTPPRAQPEPGPDAPVPTPAGTPTSAPQEPPATTPPGPAAPVPPPGPASQPRRRVSVGTVLLALGALSLVVAASIFIGVYWGPMGIVGRALVLLAVTALFGALAVVVTRRHLRGSAEALWSVFLAMLSLDWFAARDQGLLGLDTAPVLPVVLVWSAVVVGAAFLIGRLGRRHLGADEPERPVTLVVPSVAAGIAAVTAGVRVGVDVADLDLGPAWPFAAASVVLGVLALLLTRLQLRIGSIGTGVVAGLAVSVTVLVAFGEALLHPSWGELVLEGRGLALLVVVLAALAAALVLRPGPWPTTALVVVAVLGAGLLAVLPTGPRFGGTGVVVACAAVAVLAAVGPAGPWGRGARLAGLAFATVLAAALAGGAGIVLSAVVRSVEGAGRRELTDPVDVLVVTADDGWIFAVAGLGLAAVALLWRRHLPERLREPTRTTAVALAVLAGWSTLASYQPPSVVLAAAVVVGGLLLACARRPSLDARTSVGAGVVALAPLAALDAWWACVVAWPLAAVVLLGLARALSHPRWRDATVGIGTWWLAATSAPVLAASGQPGAVVAFGLLGAGLVAATLATVLLGARTGRLGAELAAAAVLVWALGLGAVELEPGPFALLLLVLAGSAVGLSCLPSGRRLQARIGSAAAAGAVLVTIDLWESAAWVWPVAALVLALAAVRFPSRVERSVVAGASALAAGGSVVPATRLLGTEPLVTSLALLGAALLLVLLALLVLGRRRGGDGVEVAGAVLVAVALVSGAAELEPGPFALLLLVLAVPAVGLSFLPGARRQYSWVGAAAALGAVLVTVERWDTAVWVWPVAALALAAAAVRPPAGLERSVVAGVAALVAGGSVVPVTQVLETGPEVLALGLLGAALVSVVVARLVLGPSRGGDGVEVAGGLLGWAALAVGSTQLDAAWFAVLLLLLAVAAVGLSVPAAGRPWYAWIGAAASIGAVLVTFEQWGSAVWAWPVAALTLLVVAVRTPAGPERTVVAGAAALVAGGSVVPVAELTDLAVLPWCLAVLVAGALVVTLALLVLEPRTGADGVELAGAALVLVALLRAAAETGPASLALLLTVAGAVAAALSLLVQRRRWYRLVGAGALAAAYVLRLVASDVGVVEAYTLPFGLALLGLGLWVILRPRPEGEPPRSLVALGPGLLLTLAPSLPLALTDPTSLRALLLGIGALAVMVGGIQRRWQAPFVAGAAVVALVVLTNVGPYAWGLPRWVLIATAGALMLGAGVTWEQRVRDGRAAVRWVGAMG